MFSFSGCFLHLTEQSCGNWRGLTAGKIAEPTTSGTLHRRKYDHTLRRFSKIDSSAFVGFVVFGDTLQWTSQSNADISIATANVTILSGPLSKQKQPSHQAPPTYT